MAVAIFLAYQTIADFREKLKHPVMSVSFKEVPSYDAPGKTRGWIAYFLGNQVASADILGIKGLPLLLFVLTAIYLFFY